ncbi:3-galactosyl-N-acetylglucosaminide 4-alpha-L-fucosyltransferase FUT3-like [Rhinophrynus dorsalis]
MIEWFEGEDLGENSLNESTSCQIGNLISTAMSYPYRQKPCDPNERFVSSSEDADSKTTEVKTEESRDHDILAYREPTYTDHKSPIKGRSPLICNTCGKHFTYKSTLVRHYRTHTGQKSYVCNECGKRFVSNFNLVVHQRKHTGERPYQCSECGKHFSHKSAFNQHRKLHTREKNHVCSECGKCFSHLSMLIKHQKAQAREKAFVCLDCGKQFTTKPELLAHRKENLIPTGFCYEDIEADLGNGTDGVRELIILVWVWPFGARFPLNNCKSVHDISGCRLTANRRLYNVADAVIIHHYDIMYNKNSLPRKPRPHYQRWVWYNCEPPQNIRNLHFLDNLFNMTMTFRQDSDICIPYGRLEALKKHQNITIPVKSKLVSWVVSTWYPGAKRTDYYEELKKHIPIDVYGEKHKKLKPEDFRATISQYKFYLAFENSVYKDYITEKLWVNAFSSWTVPVVLGTSRENYERFLPRDSFIHVDDFPSAKELATFLLELDRDNERYQQYFNWRSKYRVLGREGLDAHYCKACKILQQSPAYQVIPSVAKWFL